MRATKNQPVPLFILTRGRATARNEEANSGKTSDKQLFDACPKIG